MLWLQLKSKKQLEDNWVEFKYNQPNFKIQNQIKETVSKKKSNLIKNPKTKSCTKS